MRRRSTLIPLSDAEFDPSQITVADLQLSIQGINAAREERLTLNVQDLPAEISQLLRELHELHIRWVSEDVYQPVSPYSSALTSGLHIHTTPAKDSQAQSLCPILKEYFSRNLRCESVPASFSRPDILSTHFSSTSSAQFHVSLPSLQQLVTKLQATICKPSDLVCTHNIALLNLATYVDFDFDSISQAFSITSFWSRPPRALLNPEDETITYDEWSLNIKSSTNNKNEVGVLKASDTQTESPQIHLEGYLVTIGDDVAPKPTMFFAPMRHHRLNSQQATAQHFTVSFDQPTGLHPTMRLRFGSSHRLEEPENKPEDSVCALHTYMTLPSVIFADEYAFPSTDLDPLFTEAHNVRALRSLSGERDLEVPDYVVKQWGSALLLELATPNKSHSTRDSTWDVTIPLHLRYLSPNDGGQQSIDVPWPIVFWACTADDGTKFNVNPFDRVNLGYDGLFGPRTMFYHLNPQPTNGSRLVERIDVPVLDTRILNHGLTEVLTTLLVLGGFIWIALKVVHEVAARPARSDAITQKK